MTGKKESEDRKKYRHEMDAAKKAHAARAPRS